VTLIWGWTFVAVKQAVEVVPPLEFVGIRFLVASVIIGCIAAWRIGRPSRLDGGGSTTTQGRSILTPGTAVGTAGTAVGLALLVGYATQTVGLVYTGATRSGFITGLTVVFVPLVEGLFRRRRPRADVAVAVAVAAAGLFLLTGGLPGALSGGLNKGDLLTVGTAIAFAVHVVLLSRASKHHDPLQLTFVQLAATAVGALAASAIFEEMVIPPSSSWVALAVTALGASAAALLIMTCAQRYLPPSEAGVILTLEPVFAGIAGYLLLGERIGPLGGLGAACIIAASVWVSARSSRRLPG